jgi:hypothetical protein
MATIGLPQCEGCKHLFRDEKGYSCEAFPRAIPEEILTGEHDHTKPFEGDKGIMFEPEEE